MDDPLTPTPPEIRLDPDLEGGVFADAVAVWHTRNEFTLDFLAPTGKGGYVVTSRVRVPTNVIFDVARVIAENVSRYEDAFGPLNRPPDAGDLYPPNAWGEGEGEGERPGERGDSEGS